MASQKTKTAEVAGSELSLTEHDGWDFSSFKWEQQYLCTAYKRESGYELKPEYTIVKDYQDLSGVFPSLDEVFTFVSNYLSEHLDLQDKLRTAHQAAKDWNKKRIEEGRAEKAKYYHLELADLTPEHNLYYSDLVSTRVKNVLGAADIYTLNDICHLQRSDFLRYRNCGKVAADEVEKLLHQVGLDWNTPVPQQSETVIDLSTVSDDDLLQECRKRGLKL